MDPLDDQSIYNDPGRMFKELNEANPNFPVPELKTFEEVQSQAKEQAKIIFSTQKALAGILDKHEHILTKRWMKKSTEQRRKILVAVFPQIPLTHRPDFQAMRREKMEKTRSGTQFRDSWLLPSLNVEDLTQPRNLILFLRSRARNPPGVFVNADFNSFHVGHVTQAIKIPYLTGYTMLLTGQNTLETYGRMLSWDEDPEAFDMMSTGVGIQPGEGLIAMEIQKRKLEFLLESAQIILQGVNADANNLPPRPGEEEKRDLLARNEADWPSLTVEMLEAPYRVPDRFEVSKFQSFIKARRDQAEDHLWSLREDPSYFQDAILEWSEHRQERIPTADGRSHPVLKQDLFWERVLGNVIVNAYLDFLAWHGLSQEVEKICGIVARNACKGNKTGVELSDDKDFEIAIAHFSHYVTQVTKGALELWRVGMAASPPLRRHFVRSPQDPTNTKIQVRSKSSSAARQDNLLWLMETLTMDYQLFLCGIENVCDELEREIRSSAANNDRVSAWIASLISDLSFLAEIQRQIDLRSPGPTMVEDVEEETKKHEYEQKTKLLSQVFHVLTKPKDLASTALPLSKFNHPSQKRRTQAVTEQMQQAEKELDNVWTHVDRHSLKTCGKTVHHLLAGILDNREIRRTPDWQPPESKPAIKSPATEDATSIAAGLGASSLMTPSKDTVSPRDFATDLHQKPKTRGSAQPSVAQPTTDVAAPAVADWCPKFKVSKRGFKIFTTLFYTPSEANAPGEIPWSEFLSAMASVGFSLKKLDGSAWLFAPVDDLFGRSIIFHEPHPSNKIPFKIARRFGRRLERAFGWTSESFERA